MTENNERRSFFHNFWGNKFLIFSAVLILVVLIAVMVLPDKSQDPQMDFQDVLESDSLQQIEEVKEEEIENDYVEPERDQYLWDDTL